RAHLGRNTGRSLAPTTGRPGIAVTGVRSSLAANRARHRAPVSTKRVLSDYGCWFAQDSRRSNLAGLYTESLYGLQWVVLHGLCFARCYRRWFGSPPPGDLMFDGRCWVEYGAR